MPAISTFSVDNSKRRLLTPQNLAELGITTELVRSILDNKQNGLGRQSAGGATIYPDGLSINETNFGTYTAATAAEQGWMAYLEIGAPLIEERADIIQPQADVLSTRAYENRAGRANRFEDRIDFSIENTISWSLSGTGEFTVEGHIGAELMAQLEQSLEQSQSQTNIVHNHKDDQGSETQAETASATTNTATGSATGTSDLTTSLMLGITGSISGTVTTSWTSSSTVSGELQERTRVKTMAVQRRQIKQYTYEFPITFGGLVALHYAEPVTPFGGDDNPRPAPADGRVNVVPTAITRLGLLDTDKKYRPKGVAETVSTLDVDHIIFEAEALPLAENQLFNVVRPHTL
ncbi:hypothetical protein [Phyllobacterium endophyticum]|uniref:hypothetical protein n=1 Tax=Phyllobacterium endophyticum TaxID=1149773 RepID=UPI0011C9EEAC|nr:hypothetical protein [Phyllobacterium endophyticum]TXR46973.1 hypothetical protein FVA77_22475 [Phyllobacterium endophyticum]